MHKLLSWIKRHFHSLPADYEARMPELPQFDPAATVIRQHLIFTGRVQGVSFRFQSTLIAQKLNLTGWVKNLADGSVEMEVQGPKDKVDFFKKCLKKRPPIIIAQIKSQDLKIIESEKEFKTMY